MAASSEETCRQPLVQDIEAVGDEEIATWSPDGGCGEAVSEGQSGDRSRSSPGRPPYSCSAAQALVWNCSVPSLHIYDKLE